MGLFAMGSSALGISVGVDVKVLNDAPGPHRMRAWKPGEGSVAWGMSGPMRFHTACGGVVVWLCVAVCGCVRERCRRLEPWEESPRRGIWSRHESGRPLSPAVPRRSLSCRQLPQPSLAQPHHRQPRVHCSASDTTLHSTPRMT